MARGNTKKPQSIGGDRRAGAASLAGGSIGEGGQRRQTDSSTGKSIIYEGRSKVATSTTKNARKSQWTRQRGQRGRQERGYRSDISLSTINANAFTEFTRAHACAFSGSQQRSALHAVCERWLSAVPIWCICVSEHMR